MAKNNKIVIKPLGAISNKGLKGNLDNFNSMSLKKKIATTILPDHISDA